MSGSGERDGEGWTDLARNASGIGISYEAVRRRESEGLGADRSWPVGADGEVEVAEVLAELTAPSRWERLRGRGPAVQDSRGPAGQDESVVASCGMVGGEQCVEAGEHGGHLRLGAGGKAGASVRTHVRIVRPGGW